MHRCFSGRLIEHLCICGIFISAYPVLIPRFCIISVLPLTLSNHSSFQIPQPEKRFSSLTALSNLVPMLKNFFKTAARIIVKHNAYSLINFVALTSGLALSLLIITYVRI